MEAMMFFCTCRFVLGYLTLVFATAVPLSGQVVTRPDHQCYQTRVCKGVASAGTCRPQGLVCVARTCGNINANEGHHDGCSWSFDWKCEPMQLFTCTEQPQYSAGSDCRGKCAWITYNICGCKCTDYGDETYEEGTDPGCN